MKIIYDDIIYSLQKSGGGSVYWTEVIRPTANDAEHYIYDNAVNNIFYKQLKLTKEHRLSSRGLMIKRFTNPKYQYDYPFLFHSSYFRYCRNKKAINITTVHDFTSEKYIKGFHGLIHSLQLRSAVSHSKGIICVSENTKKDFLEKYPNYSGDIVVIHNGYNSEVYYDEHNETRTKDVLFVGARTSYKRFDIAVSVISKLKDCRLVIVGGGQLTKAERHLLDDYIPGRYEKKGFIDNDELRHLYNTAFFLLYPSEYEGFGIPLLEAQACACPVLCQEKSSIPEVVRDTALYFRSDYITGAVESAKLLYNSETYSKYQKLGLENVKSFSWQKSACLHQEFYEKIWNKYTFIK